MSTASTDVSHFDLESASRRQKLGLKMKIIIDGLLLGLFIANFFGIVVYWTAFLALKSFNHTPLGIKTELISQYLTGFLCLTAAISAAKQFRIGLMLCLFTSGGLFMISLYDVGKVYAAGTYGVALFLAVNIIVCGLFISRIVTEMIYRGKISFFSFD